MFNDGIPQASEIVIGLVGAVGINLKGVSDELKEQFAQFGYSVKRIKVSDDIIKPLSTSIDSGSGEYKRTNDYMNQGDSLREKHGNQVLASHAIKLISKIRSEEAIRAKEKAAGKKVKELKLAYIIESLKRPEEVCLFREVYGNGFNLIGIHADREQRQKNLVRKGMDKVEALRLIERDQYGIKENKESGQNTDETFHLSDFFVDFSKSDIDSKDSSGFVKNQLTRIVHLLFGAPHVSPTFGEYAMFTAYAASLRSKDLSRQIGAAIVRDEEVLSTGMNEVPKFGGGVYSTYVSKDNYAYLDFPSGADKAIGYDPNKHEIEKIAQDIINQLKKIEAISADAGFKEQLEEAINNSALKDLTEYSRVVHAEMEALSMCARNHITTRGAKLYVTTFPCHTCAKLMLAAGIVEVVYIEPYPKSKSLDLFPDSITDNENVRDKMLLTPFFGIAPSRFVDMFSMTHPILPDRERKYRNAVKDRDGEEIHKKGDVIEWKPDPDKNLRYQLSMHSYLDREKKNRKKLERL